MENVTTNTQLVGKMVFVIALLGIMLISGCLSDSAGQSQLNISVVNGDNTTRVVSIGVYNGSEKIEDITFETNPSENNEKAVNLSPGQYLLNISSGSGRYLKRHVDIEKDCKMELTVAVNEDQISTEKSDCVN